MQAQDILDTCERVKTKGRLEQIFKEEPRNKMYIYYEGFLAREQTGYIKDDFQSKILNKERVGACRMYQKKFGKDYYLYLFVR